MGERIAINVKAANDCAELSYLAGLLMAGSPGGFLAGPDQVDIVAQRVVAA